MYEITQSEIEALESYVNSLKTEIEKAKDIKRISLSYVGDKMYRIQQMLEIIYNKRPE